MISIARTLKDNKRLFAQELAFFSAWLNVSRALRPFSNLYIKRIEILFDKTSIIALGALEVSKSYTQREAYESLPVIKTTIAHFIRFRSRLEEVEFLGNMGLKSKSNLVLDALFDLESSIRMKSFSGLCRKGTDTEILDCLAAMSKNAIESRLNRQ
jgi:hypothetical protein